MTPDAANPLYDERAEQAVLGAMMEDNATIPKVIPILGTQADVFYNTAHQIIYQAILKVYEKQRTADPLLVGDEIKRNDEANRIGGLVYLYDLVESVPETSNVEHYAQIVKEKATRRVLFRAGKEIIESVRRPETPVDELVDGAQHRIFEIANETVRQGSVRISQVVKSSMADIERIYHSDQRILGVSTGFTDLDLITSGFQPADFIVIAARPSMGKSILAHNIATNIALEQKRPVLLFSLEMSKESVVLRMLAAEARIDFGRLRTGYLTPEDWPKLTYAASALHSAPLFINDTPSISLMEFKAESRRMKAEHPELAIIIVDYLQLMRAAAHGGVYRDTYQETTEISHALKEVAREVNVPLVALSQLSRGIEKRPDQRPQLSDLRESGAIEQDADLVAFIHRDDYYMEGAPEQGVAELIIKKQRNGPQGTIKLDFNRRQMRFDNYSGVA